MKYKNSFFRVNIKNDGTYLDLFPAVADGKKLDVKEVIAYLDDVNIVDYDVKSIKDALKRLNDKIIQKRPQCTSTPQHTSNFSKQIFNESPQ